MYAGVRAAEVVADEPTEEAVEKTDEGENERNVDAADESEQTGVASQFITELMEGTQTFLCLSDE